MSNIIDFQKFKEERENNNILENNYLKFLTHVNNFTGVPKSLDECAEVLYYCMRYLQGTVNGISVLTMLTPMKTEDIEELKHITINWLQEVIETVKNL